jgi:23S rRNA (cytidine1920-2'-O)/16S rRNA (cytidine1409-2'-O)-methyltransferase
MKPRKERIDVLLVERGLAESRAKAQALILAGQVVVGDQRVDKPGTQVSVDAELRLKGEVRPGLRGHWRQHGGLH